MFAGRSASPTTSTHSAPTPALRFQPAAPVPVNQSGLPPLSSPPPTVPPVLPSSPPLTPSPSSPPLQTLQPTPDHHSRHSLSASPAHSNSFSSTVLSVAHPAIALPAAAAALLLNCGPPSIFPALASPTGGAFVSALFHLLHNRILCGSLHGVPLYKSMFFSS